MTKRYRVYVDDSIIEDDPYYVGPDKRLSHLEHPVGEYVLWEDYQTLLHEKDDLIEKLIEIEQIVGGTTKLKRWFRKRKSLKMGLDS